MHIGWNEFEIILNLDLPGGAVTEPSSSRLTEALEAFVAENNIQGEIQFDEIENQSFLFFAVGGKIGSLQCGIHVGEEDGYIMIYLINFGMEILEENIDATLRKLNAINLETKIGGFQLMKYEKSSFVRFYLGFPADDVVVDEDVIYNLLAECTTAFDFRTEDLKLL